MFGICMCCSPTSMQVSKISALQTSCAETSDQLNCQHCNFQHTHEKKLPCPCSFDHPSFRCSIVWRIVKGARSMNGYTLLWLLRVSLVLSFTLPTYWLQHREDTNSRMTTTKNFIVYQTSTLRTLQKLDFFADNI